LETLATASKATVDETTKQPQKRGRKPKVSKTEEPQDLTLTNVERLSLRLFLSDMDRFSKAHNLAFVQRMGFIKQIDPDGTIARFDKELSVASQGVEEAGKQYQEVVSAVEKRLGISLKDFSFDADTGVLRRAG